MKTQYEFIAYDLTDLCRLAPVSLRDFAHVCHAIETDTGIVVHHPEGTLRVSQRRLVASNVPTMSHQQARRVK